MILLFFVLLFFSVFNIPSSTESIIKKCEAPFVPINRNFNLTNEHLNFPIHYIFLLNTNLDHSTQEQILTIYYSMTCLIPAYSNTTKFHLITLGENNATKINYGSDPSKWLDLFEKNIPTQKVKSTSTNICEQLRQGLREYVFQERNGKMLLLGLKNFVMFQQLDADYDPEECEDVFYGFFFLTHTAGLSQNVITYGPSSQSQQPIFPSMINRTDDPRFYTGASIHFENFYGFNSSNNIVYAAIEPFVTEMVTTSISFVKSYKTIETNETVFEFVEDMLLDLPFANVSDKKPQPLSSPSINTVTIFAVILVILLLATIIIVSSYDQSFFTDRNFIRERAVRFRRSRGRRNTDTVGLVEVPMENLSESIFGESPRIQSYCEEPLLDLTQTTTSDSEGSSSNVNAAPAAAQCPNLIIQIDDDSLSEIKLGE